MVMTIFKVVISNYETESENEKLSVNFAFHEILQLIKFFEQWKGKCTCHFNHFAIEIEMLNCTWIFFFAQ